MKIEKQLVGVLEIGCNRSMCTCTAERKEMMVDLIKNLWQSQRGQ